LVAVGLLIGGFAGWLLRAWVQSLFARRDRAHERGEIRRERGLELLGEIRALLDDQSPRDVDKPEFSHPAADAKAR
jgi:hypothetical protein